LLRGELAMVARAGLLLKAQKGMMSKSSHIYFMPKVLRRP
jgi:hypothetical protein